MNGRANYRPMPRTHRTVHYAQKKAAKSLGAKWDATVNHWYVPESIELAPFAAWLNGGLTAGSAVSSEATVTTVPAPTTPSTSLSGTKSGVSQRRAHQAAHLAQQLTARAAAAPLGATRKRQRTKHRTGQHLILDSVKSGFTARIHCAVLGGVMAALLLMAGTRAPFAPVLSRCSTLLPSQRAPYRSPLRRV